MSEQSFEFHQILPPGADDTPYRKLTDDFVDTVDFDGGELLKVDPEGLSLSPQRLFGISTICCARDISLS